MKLTSHLPSVVVVCALNAPLLLACSAPTDELGRGKELYGACTNCHGPDASGR